MNPMQTDAYGWTAFDYTGGFATYDGKLFDSNDPSQHADHGSIKTYIKDALFLSSLIGGGGEGAE